MQLPNNKSMPPNSEPDLALSVDDLTFKSGFATVLRNIQFQLPAGETLLLIGPNGAGKSTLLKCLAGLLPHHGTKQVFGGSPRKNYSLRHKIGYLGHESFLYLKFTARENLIFFADLYGANQNVERLLEEYHLNDFGEQLVETFSRGMKQKLSIARALLHNPELIMLDEPFTGLDQAASLMLRGKILELKKNRTLVLTTHELEQGFELCEKILILKAGRQVFFGNKTEITGNIRQFYHSMTV